MGKPLSSSLSSSPLVYAHRGASFELPENTIESFRLALELGAHALETDCHLTRDGHVVLSHDASLERTCGVAKTIPELTLQELSALDIGARFVARRPGVHRTTDRFRIPTLEEALEACPDILFNVDAKQTTPDMIPALVRAIRRARAEDRVRIASFSARNLARARALGYAGETGLAPSEVARAMFLPAFAQRLLRVSGDAAQVPLRAWGVNFASQPSIDRLHSIGLRVDFWTIDDPTEAKRLFALGADGVMTDDPRSMRELSV
jgi:glycerophosphoryl diester phosphodiesterase